MDKSTRARAIATFNRFWNDDDGLVTIEWVGLAAAVIALAIGVISVIQGPINSAASTVGTKVASTQNAQNDQTDHGGASCTAPGLVIARAQANEHASPCQAR